MGVGIHLGDEVPDNRGDDVERGGRRADASDIGGRNNEGSDEGREASEASCSTSWQS
jgi:hypothetical protein